MARYNTISATSSVAGGATITTPSSGLLTTLTGPGTVTIPNPVLYAGQTQTYYNSGLSNVTLSTPSGVITGGGLNAAATIILGAYQIITLTSDGTNYIIQNWLSGSVITQSLTATGGTINAVAIGGTTPAAGSFNALTVTSGSTSVAGLSASGTISITNNAAVTLGTAATGALQVTGGVGVAGGITVASDSYFGSKITIGVATPRQALTIGQNATSVSTATPDSIDIGGTYSSTAGQNLKLKLWNAVAVTNSYIGLGISSNSLDYVVNDNGTNSFSHNWYTGKGSSTTPVQVMSIPSAGYLQFPQTTGVKIRLYDASNDKYGFEVQSSELRIYSGAQGVASGGITFGKYDGTTWTENIRFTNSGSVGIGTPSPSLTSGYTGLNVVNTGYTQAKLQSSATSAGLEFYPSGGHNWEFQATNDPAFILYDRNQNLYRWSVRGDTGNISIGYNTTNDQGYKLSVNGTGLFSSLTVGGTNASNSALYGLNRKWFDIGIVMAKLWYLIATLPGSTAGTGDGLVIEITGLTGNIQGKGKLKIAMGQRGGFWYQMSNEGAGQKIHVQVYQQSDGSSNVYVYTPVTNTYTAGDIWYYQYGWSTDIQLYDNAGNSGTTTTPGGTVIFDSYSGSSFNDPLYVGALSKTSGSFRINHPLPALTDTHELVHSFIEGPKADLIYRGTVALVNGIATVNIDTAATMTEGTFVVLCRDIQCFVNNTTGWDAVRGNVVGNILTITCQNNNSTDTVSWMVIGERQDPHMYETHWTDDNGKVIVEPLKNTQVPLDKPEIY